MSLVSVIICTWNRAASLAATLNSLRQQQLAPGQAVEVIVVDNNSSDDTRAAVARLQAGWTLGMLAYVFEGRQGKQFALNAGIGASNGAVLAFTDDDILFPQGWLGAVDAAFADPGLDLAGGRTFLTWPPEGAPAWYDESMRAILGGVDLGESRALPAPPGYAPAGANLVARRSLFDNVGTFSEIHFRHMDYEFGMRCIRAGMALAYEPSLVVYAPVDPQILSKRYFRRWSFKAGIGACQDGGAAVARLFGVPLWLYRQLLQDVLAWPFGWLAGTTKAAFVRELRILRSYGAIASCWRAALQPATYPQWVEHYSQKEKNLY